MSGWRSRGNVFGGRRLRCEPKADWQSDWQSAFFFENSPPPHHFFLCRTSIIAVFRICTPTADQYSSLGVCTEASRLTASFRRQSRRGVPSLPWTESSIKPGLVRFTFAALKLPNYWLTRCFIGKGIYSYAYVIMANHVHVLITPRVEVSELMHSLKRFTARKANQILGLTGIRSGRKKVTITWCVMKRNFDGSPITSR
jgi:hypothetical protein